MKVFDTYTPRKTDGPKTFIRICKLAKEVNKRKGLKRPKNDMKQAVLRGLWYWNLALNNEHSKIKLIEKKV